MNMQVARKSWITLAIAFAIIAAAAASASAETTGPGVGHRMSLGVREVAMVSSSKPDTLVLDAGGDRDGTLRLQYTAVNAAGTFRTIYVSWRAGDHAPRGTTLHLRALSIPAGAGRAGGDVTVSNRPAALIRGIPSCATGASGGALVEYRLSIDDPDEAKGQAPTSVTLVFTIGDDL